MASTLEEQIERFWSKVDKSAGPDGCWIWTKSVFKNTGYGQATSIKILPGSPQSAVTTAHRQAWLIVNGPVGEHVSPISGKLITNKLCHQCPNGSNRLCCNPSHLIEGTDKINAAHRTIDGTETKGVDVKNAKLNAEVVRTARWLYTNQVCTLKQLSKLCQVSPGTMHPALNGTTWNHV